MLPEKLLESLNRQQKTFLEKFFRRCNETFLEKLMMVTYPKNHVLVNADDACSYVYILLKGRLQAVEEYAAEQPYHFTELKAIDIVGDYELFTESFSRIITLTTLESSLFLIIPATEYITWILNDANALSIRIRMLIQQIVEQTTFERQNFFLDNRSRFLHFLFCECRNTRLPHKICYTHEEISNKLGCSLRTINRTISQLQEQNFISIKKGKIVVSSEQLAQIKHTIDHI